MDKIEGSNEAVSNSAGSTRSVSPVSSSSFVDSMRANPWKPATLVLVVALIGLFLFNGFGSGVTGNAVKDSVAADNLVNFVKAQGANASVVSVTKESGLYKVTVDINGQTAPVYVTLDGSLAIPQTIPLTGNAAAGTSSQTTAASKKISDLNLDDYLSVGSKTAKVTVVEFSDFSCPYCEAASGDNEQMVSYMKQSDPSWEPIVTNLMKDYVNTGKVRFVYIFSAGHTGGHPASSVGWCLNDQSSSMFWKYYPKVFAQESAGTENLTLMLSLAKSVGADMTKLQSCLDSKKYDSRFASEQAISDAVGVSGTPAFFVNDNYVAKGAMSYVDFKKAVDSALAGA